MEFDWGDVEEAMGDKQLSVAEIADAMRLDGRDRMELRSYLERKWVSGEIVHYSRQDGVQTYGLTNPPQIHITTPAENIDRKPRTDMNENADKAIQWLREHPGQAFTAGRLAVEIGIANGSCLSRPLRLAAQRGLISREEGVGTSPPLYLFVPAEEEAEAQQDIEPEATIDDGQTHYDEEKERRAAEREEVARAVMATSVKRTIETQILNGPKTGANFMGGDVEAFMRKCRGNHYHEGGATQAPPSIKPGREVVQTICGSLGVRWSLGRVVVELDELSETLDAASLRLMIETLQEAAGVVS